MYSSERIKVLSGLRGQENPSDFNGTYKADSEVD